MRAGNKALFVTSFLAIFAVMTVNAPSARSSANFFQYMTVMHQDPPQLHFSLLDTTQAPSVGGEMVGRFIGSTSQSSQLIEGHSYPTCVNPQYLYGTVKDGTALRRIGVTGTPIDSSDFSDTFTQMTGSVLWTNHVPAPPFNTVTPCYDLVEHYVVVGEANQSNPQLSGTSTLAMLINPATMQGYHIGGTTRFVGSSTSIIWEDVACAAYPGPDANYQTIDDNQYRYAFFYSLVGRQLGGLGILSLTKTQTDNGVAPENPWNPGDLARGPDYTNVYPKVDANTGPQGGSYGESEFAIENNGQEFIRSYYLRPGIPGCTATPNHTWGIMSYVLQVSIIPPAWAVFIDAYDLSTQNYSGLAPSITNPNWKLQSGAWNTSDINKSLYLVGDYLYATVGPGLNGDGFGDYSIVGYIPELLDGVETPSPNDNGRRGTFSVAGSSGFAGYFPNVTNDALITYIGCGSGLSTISGTVRNPYQAWGGYPGSGITNTPTPMTSIDCHTDEEKALGLNIRRAPQPFAGYYQSVDPAENFPGTTGGGFKGQGGGGACSQSAPTGGEAVLSMIGLAAVAFLLVRVVRA